MAFHAQLWILTFFTTIHFAATFGLTYEAKADELGKQTTKKSDTPLPVEKYLVQRKCPEALFNLRAGKAEYHKTINALVLDNKETEKECVWDFQEIKSKFQEQHPELMKGTSWTAYPFEKFLSENASLTREPFLLVTKPKTLDSVSCEGRGNSLDELQKISLSSEYYYFESHFRSALIENSLEIHFLERQLAIPNQSSGDCKHDADPFVKQSCGNLSICTSPYSVDDRRKYAKELSNAYAAIIKLNTAEKHEIGLVYEKCGAFCYDPEYQIIRPDVEMDISKVKAKYSMIKNQVYNRYPLLTEPGFTDELTLDERRAKKYSESEFFEKIDQSMRSRLKELKRARLQVLIGRANLNNGTATEAELDSIMKNYPIGVDPEIAQSDLVNRALLQGRQCFVSRRAARLAAEKKTDIIVATAFLGMTIYVSAPLAGLGAASTAGLTSLLTVADLMAFKVQMDQFSKECFGQASGQTNVRLWDRPGQCQDAQSRTSNVDLSNCVSDYLMTAVPTLLGAGAVTKLGTKAAPFLKAKLDEGAEALSHLNSLYKTRPRGESMASWLADVKSNHSRAIAIQLNNPSEVISLSGSARLIRGKRTKKLVSGETQETEVYQILGKTNGKDDIIAEAVVDELGVINGKGDGAGSDILRSVVKAAATNKRGVENSTLVFFDVNDLGKWNKFTKQNQDGDALIKEIIKTIKTEFSRDGDFLVRYGGDELVLVSQKISPAILQKKLQNVIDLVFENPKLRSILKRETAIKQKKLEWLQSSNRNNTLKKVELNTTDNEIEKAALASLKQDLKVSDFSRLSEIDKAHITKTSSALETQLQKNIQEMEAMHPSVSPGSIVLQSGDELEEVAIAAEHQSNLVKVETKTALGTIDESKYGPVVWENVVINKNAKAVARPAIQRPQPARDFRIN